MPTATPAIATRSHLEEFFSRIDPARGRLIFAIDATASRQPTWDTAAQLTAQMFSATGASGGLDLQLVYYCGPGKCIASRWFNRCPIVGNGDVGRVLPRRRNAN